MDKIQDVKKKLLNGLEKAAATKFSRQELYYLNIIYEAEGNASMVWGRVFHGAESQAEKNYRSRILDKLDHHGFIHIEKHDGSFKAKHFHIMPELLFQLEERDPELFYSDFNPFMNLIKRWKPYNPPVHVNKDQDVAYTAYLDQDILLEKSGKYEFRFQHTVDGVIFTISKE